RNVGELRGRSEHRHRKIGVAAAALAEPGTLLLRLGHHHGDDAEHHQAADDPHILAQFLHALSFRRDTHLRRHFGRVTHLVHPAALIGRTSVPSGDGPGGGTTGGTGGQPPPSAWNRLTVAWKRASCTTTSTSCAWNRVCCVLSSVTRSMVPSRSRVSERSKARRELVTTSRWRRSRSAVCAMAMSAFSTSEKAVITLRR